MAMNRLISAVAGALALLLANAPGVAVAHDLEVLRSGMQSEGSQIAPALQTLEGTVHELVVDDPTRGTSDRYVELQLDDGTLVSLKGASISALGDGTRVAVSGRFNGKPLEVDSARALAPASNATVSKANAEVEGTLAVLHADDFAHGRSAYMYEVHQASGKVQQLAVGSLPGSLAPGMRLRVVGHAAADGASLTPSRITILARPAATSSDATTTKAATANNVLVVMANFSDTAAPAYTSTQTQQVMTTNSDSVSAFFQEASYGSQLMNVTVTPGWVTMNLAQPSTCGATDWQTIGNSADAASTALGAAYDPAAYSYVVYLFPSVPACGWLGLAYIGSPHKAWINGVSAFRTQVIAHEMGHNFGLLHAASVRCGTGVIGGSCSVSEYGDPFDTMGNQRAMHYNAVQKSKLAWIPSSSVKTHPSGSATYTLTPLEVAGGATYAVKVPTSSTTRTYWVEFRQPIGFDAPLSGYANNGAEIRVASPFETYCSGCDDWSDDTELLDMTPSTSAFTDATLVAGQTFSDPTYGVNITVVSASASALTVQVATGGASSSPAATATTLASGANPSITGAVTAFTATVTGVAPTGTLRFTDNGATIYGCGSVSVTGSGNSRSGACSTNALVSGIHTIVASYSGDTANAASTSTALSQVVNAPVNGTNVALASNGGVASASSTYSSGFAPIQAIDNARSGAGWGTMGGWNDATATTFPDWLQVNFNGSRTIDHVVVYSVQDNYLAPVEPTDTMTFTRYGLTAFQVQGWNGSAWVALASVGGNNLVKRTVSFASYTTDRIRISVTGSADGRWSRITEVEAWSPSPAAALTNVALASNGGVASASSTYSGGFAPREAIDNVRSGATWGINGGWNDSTASSFPDWLQVNFSGAKTIDHVVVYSVQDNYLAPVEPTDSMTFTRYGLTDFQVQGWNGSAWVTLASVSGNNLVKRSVYFTAYRTDRIRLYITGTKDGVWSRVTEIEAWAQ